MLYVKNVPPVERLLRAVLGLLAAGLSLALLAPPWSWLAAASAAGIVVSGLVGFCPMCAMVGRRLDREA